MGNIKIFWMKTAIIAALVATTTAAEIAQDMACSSTKDGCMYNLQCLGAMVDDASTTDPKASYTLCVPWAEVKDGKPANDKYTPAGGDAAYKGKALTTKDATATAPKAKGAIGKQCTVTAQCDQGTVSVCAGLKTKADDKTAAFNVCTDKTL